MFHSNRLALLLAVTVVLAAIPSASLASRDHDNLVSAAWLRDHLGDKDLLLLDASPAPAHAKQHIPGAVSVNVFTYGVREMPTADVQALFRSWGLSKDLKVVLYDQGANMMATRGFFSLYYYGYPAEDLLLLDGGLAKWVELGLPVTAEPTPAPAAGTFTIRDLREDARVRTPEVLAASGSPNEYALLEALGADWHFGETAPFDRPGHIPHGILLPSADFYNADKTFKSPTDIRRMLDYLGVGRDETIYTYCGGGVAASVPFFALRFLVGCPKVELYVESELGWLGDDRELPYWTYDAPYLMRDAGWVKSFGGPMLRMYGSSQVSIVDVRPAAAYAEGHVPFALNIPAEVFAAYLNDVPGLSAVLGPAGVDPAHEAVIVSGAGLTPEAALSWVAIEGAGQRKVSILMDAAATWASAGIAVAKEATIVGPRNSPKDQCVPAVTYATTPRRGLVITDAAATQGAYPNVFVASGPALPARMPAGTVVHVPYGSLLDEHGAPKAAAEIWHALVKAGVPRYAALICVDDDPGAAAANCYLLRLMGFPDVKMLVR